MTQKQIWRLLVTPPLPGALNMAIDQTLLETYASTGTPTLRFYQWSPACLSLGFAQRLQRDVNQEACTELGIDIVRRLTGGRAILHEHEVTYALVIAVDHPLLQNQGVAQSYRVISEALCAGLMHLGVMPDLAPRPDGYHAKSAACFDLPSDYEITLQGRKLVGSAQARQCGVLLQHGTILLHADVQQLARVLQLPTTLEPEALAQRLIALDEALPASPSFDTVMTAVIQGIEHKWGIQLLRGELTDAEEHRAVELVEQKYGTLEWTARR